MTFLLPPGIKGLIVFCEYIAEHVHYMDLWTDFNVFIFLAHSRVTMKSMIIFGDKKILNVRRERHISSKHFKEHMRYNDGKENE